MDNLTNVVAWQVSVKNLIAALDGCPAARVAKLMAALEIEEVCV